jgi:hypothetical protein
MNRLTIIKYLLAFFATYFFLQNVEARTLLSQTHCQKKDCAQFGILALLENGATEIRCKQNDCGKFGWFAFLNDELAYETVCKNESCFTNGWVRRFVFNPNPRQTVTCKQNNCLRYGWVIYGRGPNSFAGNVTCKQGDCLKYGTYNISRKKSLLFPVKRAISTTCNDLDCLHDGWVTLTKPAWDKSDPTETLR